MSVPTTPAVQPMDYRPGTAEVKHWLRQGTTDLGGACAFLGIGRSLAGRMCERYRDRTSKLTLPVSVEDAMPRRDKRGAYTEIANCKVGGRVVIRTDYLILMRNLEGAA